MAWLAWCCRTASLGFGGLGFVRGTRYESFDGILIAYHFGSGFLVRSAQKVQPIRMLASVVRNNSYCLVLIGRMSVVTTRSAESCWLVLTNVGRTNRTAGSWWLFLTKLRIHQAPP